MIIPVITATATDYSEACSKTKINIDTLNIQKCPPNEAMYYFFLINYYSKGLSFLKPEWFPKLSKTSGGVFDQRLQTFLALNLFLSSVNASLMKK